MNFAYYLRDRMSYLLLYFVSNIFTVVIMQLDRLIGNKGVYRENVIYALFLAAFLLVIFLLSDYASKRKFYYMINSMESSGNCLQDVFRLPKVYNKEHKLLTQILAGSYNNFEEKLSLYRERQKEHLHFMNQWVHQMKTPVSVINLILQGKSDGLTQSQAESLGEETEKIAHGLEMILYMSRITDFEMDFKVEKVDILSVVRNVINEHKKEFIRYSIYPKIISEGEFVVDTDAKWIRFVVNQIITNSIKYSKYKDKDEKHITIEAINNNGIELSIKDEGVGMPIEDIPRVFNPFFTGTNGRNYAESTGMGMYLSKQVCNKLGHSIEIESVQNEWTRVDLKFDNSKTLFMDLVV